MEYLEGVDLEARLAESGAMPLPAVVRIVDAVASALGAAPRPGVVHRDLKPANIFLMRGEGQEDDFVKVLDFGISQVRSTDRRLSQPNHVLGTPPFMAPEQVRGAVERSTDAPTSSRSARSPTRMLTGATPFAAKTRRRCSTRSFTRIRRPSRPASPPSWDTRPLQAVLDRALAKQPAQRWGGMMELARAFEDAAERTLSDGPPIARLPRSATPAPEPGTATSLRDPLRGSRRGSRRAAARAARRAPGARPG